MQMVFVIAIVLIVEEVIIGVPAIFQNKRAAHERLNAVPFVQRQRFAVQRALHDLAVRAAGIQPDVVRELLARAAVQFHAAAIDVQSAAASIPNRRTIVYAVLNDQLTDTVAAGLTINAELVALEDQRPRDRQRCAVAKKEADETVAAYSQVSADGNVLINDIAIVSQGRRFACDALAVDRITVNFRDITGFCIGCVIPCDDRVRLRRQYCCGQQTDTERHCQQQRDKPRLFHAFLLIVRAVGLPGFYIKIPL